MGLWRKNKLNCLTRVAYRELMEYLQVWNHVNRLSCRLRAIAVLILSHSNVQTVHIHSLMRDYDGQLKTNSADELQNTISYPHILWDRRC
jgi:hypothetical protein